MEEIGRRADINEIVIKVDPRYFRPTEVDQLLLDPTQALKKLGWECKINLEQLASEMISFENEEARKESLLRKKGFNLVSSLYSPPTKLSTCCKKNHEKLYTS